MGDPSVNQLTRKKKVAFILMWVGLSVVFVFLSGEILVRVFFRYNTPDTIRDNSLHYIPSIFSRHRLKPNQVVRTDLAWGVGSERERTDLVYFINEFGYRGPSFASPKPKGICRIVVLGGSTVFDPNTNDWPHRLGNFLKAMGHTNVEVINAGVPGHATFDSLGRLYSQIWTFDPDYVLVYHGWNDFKYWRTLTHKNPLVDHFRPYDDSVDPFRNYQGFLDKLLCMSQLYVKFRNRYFIWKADVGPEGTIPGQGYQSTYSPLGVRQFKLNIQLIVDATRNIGATPILLTQATLVSADNSEEDRRKIAYEYQRLGHESILDAYRNAREVVLSVAQEKGVDFLDLGEMFSGQSDLFKDHAHTTPKGSNTIAKATATFLADKLE